MSDVYGLSGAEKFEILTLIGSGLAMSLRPYRFKESELSVAEPVLASRERAVFRLKTLTG